MNFEFGNYNVRLTFNPADIIIRIEHRENKRLYETVFVAEDFEGSQFVGGLEKIQSIIKEGFANRSGVSIKILEENIEYLILNIHVNALISFQWTIRVCALRREEGEMRIELEELEKKIKSLNDLINIQKQKIDSFNEKLISFQSETKQSIDLKNTEIKSIQSDINSFRDTNYIILSGCPVIIPLEITSLTLTDTMSSDIIIKCGQLDGCTCPGLPARRQNFNCTHKCSELIKREQLSTYNFQGQTISCPKGHSVAFPFTEYIKHINTMPYDYDTNTYLFKGFDIRPLKKLKSQIGTGGSVLRSHFRTLTIRHRLINDISPIGEITQLTDLTINCSQIRDISWIKTLKHLKTLNLEGCVNLKDVNILAELPALTKLILKDTGVINTTALTNSGLTIEK